MFHSSSSQNHSSNLLQPKSLEEFEKFYRGLTLSYTTDLVAKKHVLTGKQALIAAYLIYHKPDAKFTKEWHSQLPMLTKEDIVQVKGDFYNELGTPEKRKSKQNTCRIKHTQRSNIDFESLKQRITEYVHVKNNLRTKLNFFQLKFITSDATIRMMDGARAFSAAFWLQHPQYSKIEDLVKEKLPLFSNYLAKSLSSLQADPEFREFRSNPVEWDIYLLGTQQPKAELNNLISELTHLIQSCENFLKSFNTFSIQYEPFQSISISFKGIQGILVAYLIRYEENELSFSTYGELSAFNLENHQALHTLIKDPRYYLNKKSYEWLKQSQIKMSLTLEKRLEFAELSQLVTTFRIGSQITSALPLPTNASFFQGPPVAYHNNRIPPIKILKSDSRNPSTSTTPPAVLAFETLQRNLTVIYPVLNHSETRRYLKAQAVIVAYLIHNPQNSVAEILKKLPSNFTNHQIQALIRENADFLDTLEKRAKLQQHLEILGQQNLEISTKDFKAQFKKSIDGYLDKANAAKASIDSISVEYLKENGETKTFDGTNKGTHAIITAYLINFPTTAPGRLMTQQLRYLVASYDPGYTLHKHLSEDSKYELNNARVRAAKQETLKIFEKGEGIDFKTLERKLAPILELKKEVERFFSTISVEYSLQFTQQKQTPVYSGVTAIIIAYLIYYTDLDDLDDLDNKKSGYDDIMVNELKPIDLNKAAKIVQDSKFQLGTEKARADKKSTLKIFQSVRENLSYETLKTIVDQCKQAQEHASNLLGSHSNGNNARILRPKSI